MLGLLGITLGSVMWFKGDRRQDMPHIIVFCAVYDADQDINIEEVQRLQRKPLLQIVGHALKADAPDLFKPCSTQRLYIHGHPDFADINEVTS